MEPIGRGFPDRLRAAEAVLKIDPSATQANDVILKLLEDPDHWARLFTAKSLEGLGIVVQGAVPALEKAMRDKDRNVRLHAAVALQKIKDGIGGDVRGP